MCALGVIALTKKGMGYLFYYMAPTPKKSWEDKD